MKTLFLRTCILFCATLLSVFFAKADCTPSFTYSVSGLTVTFTNTSVNTNGTDAGLNYVWSFTGGITSTLKDPVITFPAGGFKSVYLSITDSTTGCFSGYSDTFTLVAPGGVCSASFTKTISGTTVHFNSTSVNSIGTTTKLAYYWTFSNGTSSMLKDPTVAFGTAGSKTASLTIIDSTSISGCVSSVSDSFILVAPGNQCAASFTTIVSGTTATFINTSLNTNGTSTGLTYSWLFTDGFSSSLKNPVITFITGGPKTAILTISDSATGCFSTITDTFTIVGSGTSCSASFTKSVSGLTVSFTNTSLNTGGTTGSLLYSWTFTGLLSSFSTDPVVTFPTGGSKTVTLMITDTSTATGCTAAYTDTFTLVSNNQCAASFTRSISGLTVSFINTSLNTNGSSTGLHYSWNFGDGTTSDLKNPVKTYTTGGVKHVILHITDSAQGCFSSTTDSFMVSPLCQAGFSLAVDTTQPFNFFILNTSTIRPASTFFWDFGDGATSTSITPTHTYSSFGIYRICLTVLDTLCTSTYCDSVGMDSSGTLYKTGTFGFTVLDYTTMATTGVKSIDHNLTNLSVYPNPGSGIVNLDFSATESSVVTLLVTDITGKTILSNMTQSKIGKNTETIDISALDPSIYFIQINTSTSQKVLKLIKN
jgi:PKD repeat protein